MSVLEINTGVDLCVFLLKKNVNELHQILGSELQTGMMVVLVQHIETTLQHERMEGLTSHMDVRMLVHVMVYVLQIQYGTTIKRSVYLHQPVERFSLGHGKLLMTELVKIEFMPTEPQQILAASFTFVEQEAVKVNVLVMKCGMEENVFI